MWTNEITQNAVHLYVSEKQNPVLLKRNKCPFFGTRLVESTFDMVKDSLDFGVTLLSPNEKFRSLLWRRTHVSKT